MTTSPGADRPNPAAPAAALAGGARVLVVDGQPHNAPRVA